MEYVFIYISFLLSFLAFLVFFNYAWGFFLTIFHQKLSFFDHFIYPILPNPKNLYRKKTEEVQKGGREEGVSVFWLKVKKTVFYASPKRRSLQIRQGNLCAVNFLFRWWMMALFTFLCAQFILVVEVNYLPGAHLGDQRLPLQLPLPPRGEASGQQGIFCLG